MSRQPSSPASWVQLVQALTARELVEGLGIPSRQAADMLGVAPSAVSQYLSGKRLSSLIAQYSNKEAARNVARQLAAQLTQSPAQGAESTRILLEAAGDLANLEEPARPGSRRPSPGRASHSGVVPSRTMTKWIHQRVRVEQAAVTQCMSLAQRARDELTRAIFRQIASDSLRHAEIVASLAPYLDRGIVSARASGVTPQEVERLIEGERQAEAQADTELVRHLGGTMAVLIASMEADERKHTDLLRGLLDSGFPSRRRARERTELRTAP
jgi:uncharacterized protein